MEEYLVVKTATGSIRGRKETSLVEGLTFYGFQSIPYAKPPTGSLRFKDPVPADPWTGVLDTFSLAPPAPQLDFFTQLPETLSSEDCLFLNVYINQPPTEVKTPKAVMVWIHGGGWTVGSGNKDFYGPDYFLIHDVVMVTINYRLGALGFLNLETEDCPGNFGLKDQNLALKWVKGNIGSFGGDDGNITIFGESAGGASCHHHILSPRSSGLFHKAILQSGSVLYNWGFSWKSKERGFLLGKKMGCDTTDTAQLIRFLRSAKVEDILKYSAEVSQDIWDDRRETEELLMFPFMPSTEPKLEGDLNFLSDHPVNILESGSFNKVPMLVGLTTAECIMAMKDWTKIPAWTKDTEYEQLVPRYFHIQSGSSLSLDVTNKIRQFYFPNGMESHQLLKFLSDVWIAYSVKRTISYHSKFDRTFMYVFSYEGDRALLKPLFQANHLKGTCHADELGYQFPTNMLKLVQKDSKLTEEDADYEFIKSFTKLWTDFAKTGKMADVWETVDPMKLNHMDIDKECEYKNEFETERMKFWDDLFEFVRNNNVVF